MPFGDLTFPLATRQAGSNLARACPNRDVASDWGRVPITRRPAVPSDADFARRTHHLAYRDVVERQFGPWIEEEQDRYFENDWNAAAFEILLCDGVPCGYVSIEDRDDVVHVREIVVLPAFQSRGIGSAVLREVIEQARARRASVNLGTFHLNRAANLYRWLGFRETGRTATHTLFEWRGDDAG